MCYSYLMFMISDWRLYATFQCNWGQSFLFDEVLRIPEKQITYCVCKKYSSLTTQTSVYLQYWLQFRYNFEVENPLVGRQIWCLTSAFILGLKSDWWAAQNIVEAAGNKYQKLYKVYCTGMRMLLIRNFQMVILHWHRWK